MQKTDMKVLLVGSGDYRMYETAFLKAFHELGYSNTELFAWNKYFSQYPLKLISELSAKAQNKFHIGPRVWQYNFDLIKKCQEFKPDLVFIYTGIIVYPATIKKIKEKTNAIVISYNNDDPFATFYAKSHWKYYRDSIKYCDYNFVFRQKNVKDIYNKYQMQAEVLRAYYIDEYHYPCTKEQILPNVPDVIFMGHYEADERCEYMQALIDEGINVGVPQEHHYLFKVHVPNVIPLPKNRELYNQYLCSCKIPLIFLSKINNDTYTTRCFEIPAAGAFIFSPYNEDMASMFTPESEAVYYYDKKDFVKKVKYYVDHAAEREAIAKAGRERLLKDGHETKDRVKRIIEVYDKIRKKNEKNEF